LTLSTVDGRTIDAPAQNRTGGFPAPTSGV
jgi:hypothetical protein